MYKDNIDRDTRIAFIQGDKKAFASIYNSYAKPLYRRILYLLKDPDEVDEIIQNVFIKVWTSRDNIDPDKNLYAYFAQAATTMAIDHLRKSIRTQVVCDRLLMQRNDSTISVEESYISKEDWKIVEEAIERLPTQRKLIFRLCKLEGKSYQEVSEHLSISPATISNQLVLAMKSLRQFVTQHHKEILLYGLLFDFLQSR